MNPRATILLVVLALGLAGFVVFQSTLRRDPGKVPGSPLFDFEPDEVRNVVIMNGDTTLDFRRGDDGWQINPAPLDRASPEVIRKLITLALNTPVLDRIDVDQQKDPEGLAKYGLLKSRMQLDFKGDGDHPLLFGKEAAGTGRIYVRFANSSEVYLIDDELARTMFRPVVEFRDRRLSNLRPERIERVVVRRPGGQIEIRRTAGGWRIVRPLEAAADEKAVNAFLNGILGLQIQSFVDGKQGDSGDFGLAEPTAEIRLFAEGDLAPEVLTFGAPAPGGGQYAGFSSREVTVVLPDTARKIVDVDPGSLRDPALARVNLDLVDMIRVQSKGSEFTVSRKSGGWEVKDQAKVGKASEAAVERLVETLRDTRVQRFEPTTVANLKSYGLGDPGRRVVFLAVASENTPESQAGEQTVLDLSFGKPTADGLIPVYAAMSSEIALVPAGVLEAVPGDAASWVTP